jgi:peroxiredoxin
MIASYCLLGCLLAPAQMPERTGPTPAPRIPETQLGVILGRTQELVYHGTFNEESLGSVRLSRSYRLEARVFVLDVTPRGAEAAFLTVLKHREGQATAQPGLNEELTTASVRLEKGLVDPFGKVILSPGQATPVPIEGPPPLELGAFVELPRNRVGAQQPWPIGEEGRPVQTWQITGSEMVQGTRCLILQGVQQSPDWDPPRGDRKAWRRRDTVWLHPRLGYALRLERVIETREPARIEPTQRSTLRYTLESSLQYPGQLSQDRREEIEQAVAFTEAARPMLSTPARFGPQLAVLHDKIVSHLESRPPTPYRQAVLHVKARVEAARRGEVPPPLPAEPAAQPRFATLNEPAPEFVTPDFTAGRSTQLRAWLGKPVVMVFYHPASTTAPELLHFAQHLQESGRGSVQVLGMCVLDDRDAALKQRDERKLTFPILGGSGLRISYAVETTPKIILLDPSGVVRGSYLGWSRETPAEVIEELRHWLPRKQQ